MNARIASAAASAGGAGEPEQPPRPLRGRVEPRRERDAQRQRAVQVVGVLRPRCGRPRAAAARSRPARRAASGRARAGARRSAPRRGRASTADPPTNAASAHTTIRLPPTQRCTFSTPRGYVIDAAGRRGPAGGAPARLSDRRRGRRDPPRAPHHGCPSRADRLARPWPGGYAPGGGLGRTAAGPRRCPEPSDEATGGDRMPPEEGTPATGSSSSRTPESAAWGRGAHARSRRHLSGGRLTPPGD